eukprot:1125401-Amphidinium_carterae.3
MAVDLKALVQFDMRVLLLGGRMAWKQCQHCLSCKLSMRRLRLEKKAGERDPQKRHTISDEHILNLSKVSCDCSRNVRDLGDSAIELLSYCSFLAYWTCPVASLR